MIDVAPCPEHLETGRRLAFVADPSIARAVLDALGLTIAAGAGLVAAISRPVAATGSTSPAGAFALGGSVLALVAGRRRRRS